MSIPFSLSTYSELSPPFSSSLYSPISEPDYADNALMLDNCSLQSMREYPQQIKQYHGDMAFPAQCPLPGQDCLDGELEGNTFIWDNAYTYQEQETFLNGHGPLLQFPPDDLSYSPDAYSPDHHHHLHHHAPYPTHTYTRMFRGRKSKAASEVLDELRPYACDICQAAFARSHDRDRHKRSHTGETPYQCHGCGAGFKRPDARKRHWERDPMCAQEDWRRVQNTAEGAKRRARQKGRQLKPGAKKPVRL